MIVRERVRQSHEANSFIEHRSIGGEATYDALDPAMTDFLPANGVLGQDAIDGHPVAPLRQPGQFMFTMRL